MAPSPTSSRVSAAIVAAIFALVIVLYWASHFGGPPKGGSTGPHDAAPSAAAGEHQDSIDLSDAQLSAVKPEHVAWLARVNSYVAPSTVKMVVHFKSAKRAA